MFCGALMMGCSHHLKSDIMREEVAISRILMMVGLFSFSRQAIAYPKWNSTAKINTMWKHEDGVRYFDIRTSEAFWSLMTTWTVQIEEVISCGFICRGHNCIFGVFVYSPRPEMSIMEWEFSGRVLWSANRNRMVSENATVEFRADGNLLLLDADGSLVWATNTANKGIVSMNLSSSANLQLLDASKNILWQSFDYPTDVLIPGQSLKAGMRLISAQFESYSDGSYAMEIQGGRLILYAFGSPQQDYWDQTLSDEVLYSDSGLSKDMYFFTDTRSFHYLQLQPDGNIQVHAYFKSTWAVIYDLYRTSRFSCQGAGACGTYGLCVQGGTCSCPKIDGDEFLYIDKGKPELGCKPLMQLSPNGTDQQMVQIEGVHYFALDFMDNVSKKESSSEGCKESCHRDLSCKLSVYSSVTSACVLFDRVYTFISSSSSTVNIFMKIQNAHYSGKTKNIEAAHQDRQWINVMIVLGSLLAFIILVCLAYSILRKRLFNPSTLQQALSGLPTQFSYRQLQACTKNFSKTLGHGGFGTIFFGQLPGGISVAVKKLESAKQRQKQFEAEVCTIGSIHHVNLVKLQGFCAEGQQRLLVYEFMPNGSLEKWIFGDGSKLLTWDTRFCISLGTAKGLAYLHHECRERIIHLDIKPQNILLDEDFVAKVSDFGLSKLVDKDETEIMTTMRGTPGYLAPEWLHSRITEKADVYSYGIVLLEIVCGRRCIDYKCEDPDRAYLPAWVNKLAFEGNEVGVMDARLEGAFNYEEAMRTVKVGLWCIQDDASMRPSMASVVEMLKGIAHVSDPPVVHSNKLSSAFCEFVRSLSV